jgi:para-aminobenzoate synthetase/4-amino-4-deoxychorismate lyase
MTSEINAELNEGTTLFGIFNAIFPCGSITGAPKINTMKIIEELENNKREVYCGAIGFISPEETVFSVPIRILQKQNNKKYYKYYVGGAIVWDSRIKNSFINIFTLKDLKIQPNNSALNLILIF